MDKKEYIGMGNYKINVSEDAYNILEKKYINDMEFDILQNELNIKVDENFSTEKENDKQYWVYLIYDLVDNLIETVYIEQK